MFKLLFVISSLFFVAPALAQQDSNPIVNDVPAMFGNLQDHGDRIDCTFRTNPRFNGYGHNSGIHYQGMQRLRNGWFAVTGGGKDADGARLFMISPTHVIDPVLNLSSHVGLGSYNHAGGVQVIGDYLVVPLEGDGDTSAVVFYDVSVPRIPKYRYQHDRTHPEAGAVGITQMKNQKYLMVVGRSDSNIIDFYTSRNTSLRSNPWFSLSDTWTEKEIKTQIGDDKFGNYQTLNLVTDMNGGIWLFGLHRNTAITTGGQDWIDLYKVDNPTGNVTITKRAKLHMYATKDVDMDAGAGIFISDKGAISVYASSHWNQNIGDGKKGFYLNEFVSLADFDAYVILYDDKNFQDRSLHITGLTSALSNYDNVVASGKKGFEDKASSVKWKLPVGYKCIIYEDKNYRGRTLVLKGTNREQSISNLDNKDFGDKVSSSKVSKQ